MKNKIAVRSKNSANGCMLVAFTLFCFLFSSCSPSIYIKPISEFKSATLKTKEVYFHQLKSTHKSSVYKYVTDRQLAVWIKKEDGSVKEWSKDTADRIAEKKSEPFIESQTLEIRKKAFEIVIFYTDTLLALALEKDTNEMVNEINGFGAAVKESLNALRTVQELEGLAGFIGPFDTAVKVLAKLAEIASRFLREKAIRDAIIKSDIMVQDIFKITGKEAQMAQTDTLENSKRTFSILEKAIESENFVDKGTKEKTYERYIEIKSILSKLEKQPDLEDLFEKARAAHAALVQKAADPSFEDIYERIRTFHEDVTTIKELIEEPS